ncbi:MAG TPA: ABC transporter permease [Spirochaetia bacterium]|nr:ABC transporter permease [Spirochaetia bacterium]
MRFFKEYRLLFGRAVRGSLRNPVWLFLGLFQPALYLLLFAPLLQGLSSVPGFPRGGAYSVFTPGLLVMIALFGTAYAGFGLVDQIRAGVVERLLVTPARRLAILLGYVTRDVVVLLVQSCIIVGIALPLGLSVSLPGLLVTFAMMVLTGTLMASCSYALALLLKREDSLASVLNTVASPLLLLSGITLPLTLAPKIIRSMASVNPFAYEVTASRSLFLGNFTDSAILVAVLFLGSLALLAFIWAARSFRKGTA